MSRKDPTQELERPRFYSQFWLDVAAGKRDAAASPTADFDTESESDLDLNEEFPEPEIPAPVRQPARGKSSKSDKRAEPARQPITSLADLANIEMLMKNSAEMSDEQVTDLESGEIGDLGAFGAEPSAAIVTDYPLDDLTADVDESPLGAEEEAGAEEFDEEDESDWGPARKASKGQKQRRREQRERRPGF